MDVFSHFALPFVVVYALTRRRRVALAAGIGGFAPDLDAVTAVLSLAPPLYFLGHRGLSHSLAGAPLYALGAVLLLRLRFWRRVLPVADELRFGPRLALVAVASSFTHLALDSLTMWGVPLLYPWSAERFTTGWFFYSVTFMIPFSAYLVWRLARDTLTPRVLRVTGVGLVAALFLAAGVRASTYPPDVGMDIILPAGGEWSWTTLEHERASWRATFWSWGREVGNATYLERPPVGPAAEEALALAKADVEYRAFHLYAGGPEVTQVDPREDGGWNVTFLDLMVQTQVDRAPWLPFGEDRATLRLHVDQEGVVRER